MDNEFEIIESASEHGVKALPRFSRAKDGFTRQDVANAFYRAFQMIGGTTRLALWANANPDKFYPLAAKLLPPQTMIIGVPQMPIIGHALPPTPLDHHPGFEPPTIVDAETGEPVSSPEGAVHGQSVQAS